MGQNCPSEDASAPFSLPHNISHNMSHRSVLNIENHFSRNTIKRSNRKCEGSVTEQNKDENKSAS